MQPPEELMRHAIPFQLMQCLPMFHCACWRNKFWWARHNSYCLSFLSSLLGSVAPQQVRRLLFVFHRNCVLWSARCNKSSNEVQSVEHAPVVIVKLTLAFRSEGRTESESSMFLTRGLRREFNGGVYHRIREYPPPSGIILIFSHVNTDSVRPFLMGRIPISELTRIWVKIRNAQIRDGQICTFYVMAN